MGDANHGDPACWGRQLTACESRGGISPSTRRPDMSLNKRWNFLWLLTSVQFSPKTSLTSFIHGCWIIFCLKTAFLLFLNVNLSTSNQAGLLWEGEGKSEGLWGKSEGRGSGRDIMFINSWLFKNSKDDRENLNKLKCSKRRHLTCQKWLFLKCWAIMWQQEVSTCMRKGLRFYFSCKNSYWMYRGWTCQTTMTFWRLDCISFGNNYIWHLSN